MSTPTKVVEDGRSTVEKPRSAGPRWGWLTAGVILGVGLSFIMSMVEPISTTPVSSTPDPLDAEIGERGMSEVIPGFPDGLVAVASTDGQTLELITWPVSGPSRTRPVPLGTFLGPDSVSFNASGRRIATLRTLPGDASFALYAGPPASVSLQAVDVTGYVWHDSDPSALIYSSLEDDRLTLWRVQSGRRTPQPMRSLSFEGAVVGWGDWGLALQENDPETVRMISETGEFLGSVEGRFLGSDQKGVIAVYDGRLSSVAANGDPVGSYVDVEIIGEPRVARFSPDAEMFAVQGSGGIAVFTTVYGELVATADFPVGTPDVAWSSDGRFVISPSLRGAIVLDTVDGTTHSILNQRIYGAVVLPLSN